ncbi:MAG: Uncharacterized protein LiPW41_14 [Parcubacteria group bacterium LiPW_41]|nr:MAG: Uncharacterized protein LiPW41_14 [Parcubacteria group bacterium LiPW_41]
MKRRLYTVWIYITIIILVGLFVISPKANVRAEGDDSITAQQSQIVDKQTERAELERQLAELEKEIEDNQKKISEYQKQGKSLSGEISTLNAKINKITLQIKGINLNIAKLGQEITETQKNINNTENKIDGNREALAKGIQMLHESDQERMFNILLSHEKLSDFFGNLNDIVLMQEGVKSKLEETKKLRQELLEQKQQLSDEKQDVENLKAIQLAQQKAAQSTKTQKNTLLKDTKGKESEYQKILKKTQESAAQIRSRIFELLGGGELTFEKAYNLAKIAEGASGVRASLILAILNRESLLGKNVGQCTYQKAMHPTRDIPYFLELTKRLGVDPEKVKVSCANQHGAYGGAMGPAQFIPSTWKMYEAKISAVTKSSPPNPWNNSDAFTATGVYIADLMNTSACINYGNQIPAEKTKLRERCAAAMYYAGGRWYTYRFWYGEPVVTKADQYDKDIDAIK